MEQTELCLLDSMERMIMSAALLLSFLQGRLCCQSIRLSHSWICCLLGGAGAGHQRNLHRDHTPLLVPITPHPDKKVITIIIIIIISSSSNSYARYKLHKKRVWYMSKEVSARSDTSCRERQSTQSWAIPLHQKVAANNSAAAWTRATNKRANK